MTYTRPGIRKKYSLHRPIALGTSSAFGFTGSCKTNVIPSEPVPASRNMVTYWKRQTWSRRCLQNFIGKLSMFGINFHWAMTISCHRLGRPITTVAWLHCIVGCLIARLVDDLMVGFGTVDGLIMCNIWKTKLVDTCEPLCPKSVTLPCCHFEKCSTWWMNHKSWIQNSKHIQLMHPSDLPDQCVFGASNCLYIWVVFVFQPATPGILVWKQSSVSHYYQCKSSFVNCSKALWPYHWKPS